MNEPRWPDGGRKPCGLTTCTEWSVVAVRYDQTTVYYCAEHAAERSEYHMRCLRAIADVVDHSWEEHGAPSQLAESVRRAIARAQGEAQRERDEATRNLTEARGEVGRLDRDNQGLLIELDCSQKAQRTIAAARDEARREIATLRPRLERQGERISALCTEIVGAQGDREAAISRRDAMVIVAKHAEAQRDEAQQRAAAVEAERGAALERVEHLNNLIKQKDREWDRVLDQRDAAQRDARSRPAGLCRTGGCKRGVAVEGECWTCPDCTAQVKRVEARLVAVTGAVHAMAAADPRMDGNTGDCWSCGAGLDDEWQAYTRPHHPGCAWLALRALLTGDRPTLPAAPALLALIGRVVQEAKHHHAGKGVALKGPGRLPLGLRKVLMELETATEARTLLIGDGPGMAGEPSKP